MSLKEVFKQAEEHPIYWAQRLYLSFIRMVTQGMKEKGLSRSQLAEKTGAKPSWIARVFNTNKEENITLHTISRLSLAIGKHPVLVCLNPNEQIIILPQNLSGAQSEMESPTAQENLKRLVRLTGLDETELLAKAVTQGLEALYRNQIAEAYISRAINREEAVKILGFEQVEDLNDARERINKDVCWGLKRD